MEAVFRAHLGEALTTYKAYFLDLRKRAERRKAAAGPDQHAIIDGTLQKNIQLLVESCNAYLQGALPQPRLLPVPVTLVVAAHNFRAINTILSPGDTVEHLAFVLREQLTKDGFKVAELGPAEEGDALFEVIDADEKIPLWPGTDITLQHTIPPQVGQDDTR